MCHTFMCSNLQRVPVFSSCSFLWHSTYFHSALYPSFHRRKSALNFPQITRSQLSAFRVLQNTPSRRRTPPAPNVKMNPRIWVKCGTVACRMWKVKFGMECVARRTDGDWPWRHTKWLQLFCISPHAVHRLRGGKVHTEHVENRLLHSACNF